MRCDGETGQTGNRDNPPMSKALQPDKQNGTRFADPSGPAVSLPTASTGRTEDCTRPMRQIIKSHLQRGSHPQRTSAAHWEGDLKPEQTAADARGGQQRRCYPSQAATCNAAPNRRKRRPVRPPCAIFQFRPRSVCRIPPASLASGCRRLPRTVRSASGPSALHSRPC